MSYTSPVVVRPGNPGLYSPTIEHARGMAAMAVVLYHAYVWLLAPDAVSVFNTGFAPWWYSIGFWDRLEFLLFDFGFLGVNLFFVVSGYCIHVSQAAARRQTLDRRIFMFRRLMRVYPLYLVIVLLLFILYGWGTHQSVQKGINLPNLLGHLIFWHYGGPAEASGMGISLVMWTIAIEMQFYVMYAVFYKKIMKVGLGRVALIMVGFELFYRVGSHVLWNDTSWLHPVFAPSRFAPARFGEWLLGAWLAERVAQGGLNKIVPWHALSGGVALIIASVAFGAWFGLNKYDSTDLPAAIGFFLILQGLLARERTESPGRSVVLTWLGERCYSIYLVHATVLLILASATKKQHNMYPHVPDFLLFVSGVLGALLVSNLAYLLIEKPSHAYAKRIR